ncbi:MAG TPA: molybdate ABC transporter substrate-binding protein [Methylocystis sp.]|nr:molybdate ABC transporter substrate-binding protein [Methylocystis sp.]
MSIGKLVKSTLSATCLSALTLSSAHAATQISIAAAADLEKVLTNLIIPKFEAATGGTVLVTFSASGTLEDQIIAKSPQYDLFLSADKTRPETLYTSYPSLVVGAPFFYAQGTLELWSPSVNISSGLPVPLTTNIVIANPATAPYGLAAGTVLQELGVLPSPLPTTWPYGDVYDSTNIYTTYEAIVAATYKYGFVSQSLICQESNGVKTFPSGTYHHTYPYNQTPTYSVIDQWGIEIANANRTAAETTLLNEFVAYITGSGAGTAYLVDYCFGLSQ